MPHRLAFAHLTDPHLPLLPSDLGRGTALLGKRLTGALSWWRSRRHIHRPEVLAALQADIEAHHPAQILITGDIVNIALPGEFARAAAWLARLGKPADIFVVPGNHDTYVPLPWLEGTGCWADYCAGDDAGPAAAGQDGFPTLRRRGSIAFVGVSTAVPLPVFQASGRVGEAQLERLEQLLRELGRQGLFRVVMMHHPPGQAGAPGRKGLMDRAAFRAVLARAGAELILHGHTHRAGFDSIPGPRAPIVILAPGSASAASREPASWTHLTVDDLGAGRWELTVEARGIDPASLASVSLKRYSLPRAGLNTAF